MAATNNILMLNKLLAGISLASYTVKIKSLDYFFFFTFFFCYVIKSIRLKCNVAGYRKKK